MQYKCPGAGGSGMSWGGVLPLALVRMVHREGEGMPIAGYCIMYCVKYFIMCVCMYMYVCM